MNSNRLQSTIVVALLAGGLLIAACGTGPNTIASPPPLRPPQEPSLDNRIGPSLVFEPPVDQVFGILGSPATDAVGRVYVPDYQQRVVFVFTEGGDFVHKLGGPGEGPGEFAIPVSVYSSGDSVYVYDNRLYRVSVFERDSGEVTGTHSATFEEWAASSMIGVVGNAAIFVASRKDAPSPQSSEISMSVLRAPLTQLSARGGPEVVWDLPGPETFYMEFNGFPGKRVKPFAQHPMCDVAENDVNAELFCAHSAIQIEVFSPGGDTLDTAQISVEPRRVTESDRIRALERFSDDLRDLVQVAETHPELTGLAVDADGRAWIRRATSASEGTVYWIVDQKAGNVEALRFGGIVTISDIRNGRAVGIHQDETGLRSPVAYILPSTSGRT